MKLYEVIGKLPSNTKVEATAGIITYGVEAKDSRFIPVGILNSEVKEIIPTFGMVEIEVEDDERT